MIFSVSQFPERDGDLRNYGNEALEVVKEYFGKERSSADGNVFPLLVDAHELSHDFAQFKLTIRGHDAGRMSFDDTCTIKEYPQRVPSLISIVFSPCCAGPREFRCRAYRAREDSACETESKQKGAHD